MNFNKLPPIIFFLVGILLIILGYFGLEKLPDIQRSKVAKRLPFANGSESTQKWSSSKDRGYLSIYLFNITNLESYLNEEDDTIKVKEVGPVVYSYEPDITILNWDSNETAISFAKFKTFYFEPELSKIDLNTVINTVNIPVATVLNSLEDYGFFLKFLGETKAFSNFKKYNSTVFFSKTIDEILFKGYDAKVVGAIKEDKALPNDTYGLMYNKNHTNDGVYTMYTGVDDVTKLGLLKKWNEVSLNNCWLNEKCGEIIGSDGSRFPPNLNPVKNPIVHLFSSSLFRSLSMAYKRDYNLKGIKVSRYEIEEKNFILSLEENKCYCPDPNKVIDGKSLCEYNGLLDISRCRKAPILISAPHLLYGSPELMNVIRGLEPDLLKHESYVDIDPVTGIVLKGRKRLQVNVYARKNKFGHQNKDTVVPVMWIEEAQEITDQKAILYYDAIHGLVNKASYVLIGLMIIGTLLVIAALIMTSIDIIRNNNNKMISKDFNKKKSDLNHNTSYHKTNTEPFDEKVKITTTEK